MKSILLVDDHAIVRAGYSSLINHMADYEVIAEAETGEDAIKQCREFKPDIVLMDIHMPGMGGLEACARICKQDNAPFVIGLSANAKGMIPMSFLKAGAKGYLDKNVSPDELLKALKEVSAGRQYMSAAVAHTVALESISNNNTLSNREMEVLLLVIKGYNTPKIAELLNVAEGTVSTYKHRLLQKLEVQNDVGLLKKALSQGVVDIDDIAN